MHVERLRRAAPGWELRQDKLLGRERIATLPHFVVIMTVHTSTQAGVAILGLDVEPSAGPAFPVDVAIEADVLAHELAPGG